MSSPGFGSHPVTVDSSPGFDSHPVTPPPVQPRSRSYHSARSGPALDDSRDEYCIIKYVQNLGKNTKEKKHIEPDTVCQGFIGAVDDKALLPQHAFIFPNKALLQNAITAYFLYVHVYLKNISNFRRTGNFFPLLQKGKIPLSMIIQNMDSVSALQNLQWVILNKEEPIDWHGQ
jgi:hypothetical protein